MRPRLRKHDSLGLVEAREDQTLGARQEIPFRRFVDFAREDDAVPQVEFAREPFERGPFAAVGSDEDDGAPPIGAETGDTRALQTAPT